METFLDALEYGFAIDRQSPRLLHNDFNAPKGLYFAAYKSAEFPEHLFAGTFFLSFSVELLHHISCKRIGDWIYTCQPIIWQTARDHLDSIVFFDSDAQMEFFKLLATRNLIDRAIGLDISLVTLF